jgi:hypothetical protein
MQSFSYQAQLADLGVSLACNCTSIAISSAFAIASMAFAVPFAFAASASPPRVPVVSEQSTEDRGTDPYSTYRSDGGHATTLVIMGQLPST